MFWTGSLIWWPVLANFAPCCTPSMDSLCLGTPRQVGSGVISWTSGSEAQSSLSRVLAICLSQDLSHGWILANPSSLDPSCLWLRLPGRQALPLGLRRTSYFTPPFWQRDASKGDRMSLLRLGHQRLTMGLLAHHCTCSHSLSQSLSSPVKGHRGKVWRWTPTDMMRHWWFLVQPVMNWDPQFKNLERAKSIYQLIDLEAICSLDKGLDDNSFHWHLMATYDRLKAPSQCFPNL